MLHIKYKLDTSKHHGIGLFAGEDIPKGKLIYTPSPLLDVNITQEQFDLLAENEKQEILWWGFYDNHSYEANITQNERYVDAYLVTVRDIKEGEELTQNYLEFESESDLMRRGIQPLD